jgi:type II secretory pathway component PulC
VRFTIEVAENAEFFLRYTGNPEIVSQASPENSLSLPQVLLSACNHRHLDWRIM